MLTNINMEFIQAFNPLYAVPIVAVILCAFIVYAFGFKSPVPPPSFDGIEEEKKYSKKKRSKDNQKSNKLLQNGKINGNNCKINVSSKKKEITEKFVPAEKPLQVDKTNEVEKKATKRSRVQNEKRIPHDKKKESFSHDELNDVGWVQLISKKGRKNRKRDDISTADNQPAVAVSSKSVESKSDDSSQLEESPKNNVELRLDSSSIHKKQPALIPPKQTETKDVSLTRIFEKTKMHEAVENTKPANNNIGKQHSKEDTTSGLKVLEESTSKSKKKKKKNVDSVLPEIESESTISDTYAVQLISDVLPPRESTVSSLVIADILPVNNEKVDLNQPTEVKSSNVAFDELAGFYPETKEQKKKKKVRRDH